MSLEEFVFSLLLYSKVDESNGFNDLYRTLLVHTSKIQIEGYNPIKKKDSTFTLSMGLSDTLYYDVGWRENRIGSVSLGKEDYVRPVVWRCMRYGDEVTILVYVSPSQGFLMKVGQYPSVADIHIGQIKQYDKVLDKPYLKEFTKAIGLAANGVGVGSFVYLRRIFEKLIFDAYEEAKTYAQIDESKFKNSRMDERIQMLQGFIPRFIVENHALYGILSKGVHELEEDVCLACFDCMRASIEMILDHNSILTVVAKVNGKENEKLVINKNCFYDDNEAKDYENKTDWIKSARKNINNNVKIDN